MVEITTLGSFSIKVDGEVITDYLRGSSRLWRLLDLLIINRGKPISVTSIMDSIWPEDETKTDKKTVHNLIYRLRNTLSDASGTNCVSYSNNRYSLNLSSGLSIDVFQIEDYYKASEDPDLTNEERKHLLEKASDLYNGEYTLSIYNDDVWAITAANKYKRLYTDVIVALADLYLEDKEYDLLYKVCYEAISHEPLAESVYVRLIQGLRDNGNTVQAVELCENYFGLLYKEMGIEATDQLNRLYWELKSGVQSRLDDLDGAMTGLQESSGNKAYYCDFKTFKDIYRYQARLNFRADFEVTMMLVGLRWESRDLGERIVSEAKRCLRECLMSALRKGDVVSDYSDSKMIVMLVNLDKNADIIIERVEKMFYSRFDEGSVKIDFKHKTSA